MERAALAQGNTARAGVGVAGRKPNRLRGLSVEGEAPQADLWGRDPSRQAQTDLTRQCQAQGERTREGAEWDYHAHTRPYPTVRAAEIPVERFNGIHTD